MGRIGCGDVKVFGESEARVESFGFAEDFHGSCEVEGDVAGAGANERGFWCAHDAVVGFVHAEGDLAEDVLFAILRAALFDEFFE